MRYDVEVGVGLTGPMQRLIAESVQDARALFPNQARAVQALAQMAQMRWLEYASGGRALPDGRTLSAVSGSYLESIKIREDGELHYTIYADDPKAEWIENGFPAFDMRKMLQTSDKVREGKNGKYMIIPFRHKTPGTLGISMPSRAYNWWLKQDRASSVVVGHYDEPSVQDAGARVTRNRYIWGDRMTRTDVDSLGLDPDGAGKRLVGMVRMQHDEDKGGSHLTFRVISEYGKGWMMPARRGYAPAKATFDWVQGQYEGLMRLALEEDARRLGGKIS